MKFAVLVFPGSNCDLDCQYVLRDVFHQPTDLVWHRETDLSAYDAVILPGGFSYGDYLRCGAVARFSPVMAALSEFADSGRLVLGVCNGFQVLVEAGLLPGALVRNERQHFICRYVHVRLETVNTPFTRDVEAGSVLRIPIAHGGGAYYADDDTLHTLLDDDRIVFRYCDEDGELTASANPNGSVDNIAGIINEGRNVLGMMPHPERCSEPELGSADGRYIFSSMIDSALEAVS